MKRRSLIEHATYLHALAPVAWSLFACADHSPALDDLTQAVAGSAAAQQVAGGAVDGTAPRADTERIAIGGSRLEAQYHAASGVERFRAFHDKRLDVDCAWARIPGQTEAVHCVPEKVADVVYLDDQCTEASATSVEGARGARTLVSGGEWVSGTPNEERCANHPLPARDAYRVGDQVLGRRMSLVYTSTDGKCGLVRNLGQGLRRLIPQQSGTFTRGTLRRIDVGGGLVAHRVIGEDGSEMTVGVSQRDGTLCTLLPEGPCVPGQLTREHGGWSSAPGGTRYTDEQCQTPAFTFVRSSTCDDARFGIDVVNGAARVYPLVPTQRLFTREPAAGATSSPGDPCRATADEGHHFARGPEVTATLGTGRRLRRGDGPLFVDQVVAAPTDRTVPLERGSSFEDAQGRPCTVVPAADGSLRCFPDRMRIWQSFVFADDRCTEPLFDTWNNDIDVREMLLVPNQERGAFPAVISWVATAKVYEGARYLTTPDGCVPDEDTLAKKLLVRDRHLPFSALPEVTAVAH